MKTPSYEELPMIGWKGKDLRSAAMALTNTNIESRAMFNRTAANKEETVQDL